MEIVLRPNGPRLFALGRPDGHLIDRLVAMDVGGNREKIEIFLKLRP
jgi:hypothetical protein